MRTLVLGTAGHIDHGKSALVTALTGTNPDRLKEEQARGITIELGFAHATIDDVHVAFVDVPGHERFVRTMLAGAGGIGALLFVVAANEGVMPQTREHFAICRLLGVLRGVIALTKSDLVSADAIELVKLDISDLVAGSFLEDAQVVPVSVRTSDGLGELRAALAALADDASSALRAREDVARLAVDRSFSVKGFGTIVTGTLVSGAIREEDTLEVLPSRHEARVRGLNRHNQKIEVVHAPSRTAVNLGSVAVKDVARGVTLATPGTLAVTRYLDARVEVLREARPLRHGARLRVHQGTSVVTAVVSLAASRSSGSATWMAFSPGDKGGVEAGGEAYVRLHCAEPLVVTRGDRVILRSIADAATIGGGGVLDPEPPMGGLRRAGALDRFRTLDAGVMNAVGAMWLREAGSHGLTARDLVRRGGMGVAAAEALAVELVAGGLGLDATGRIVSSGLVDALERLIIGALEVFHREQPGETGVSRESLRSQIAPRDAEWSFELALRRLTEAARVAGSDRIALAAHRPPTTAGAGDARRAVERLLEDAGLTPPEEVQLVSVSGLAKPECDRLVRALVAEGVLVKSGGLLFHRDAVQRVTDEVRALKGAGNPSPARLDVAWFKTRFGLSRKFAIPLLEHLDRTRVTRRAGEARIVL